MRRGPLQMKTVLFQSEPRGTTTAEGRLIVALDDHYELRTYNSSGDLMRVVSLARELRPISSDDQAATLSVHGGTIERGMASRGAKGAAMSKSILENVSVARGAVSGFV